MQSITNMIRRIYHNCSFSKVAICVTVARTAETSLKCFLNMIAV